MENTFFSYLTFNFFFRLTCRMTSFWKQHQQFFARLFAGSNINSFLQDYLLESSDRIFVLLADFFVTPIICLAVHNSEFTQWMLLNLLQMMGSKRRFIKTF